MDQTRSQTLDRRILPLALALGVAGDLLFRNGVPALSLFVAVSLLVGAAIQMKRTTGSSRAAPDGWMLAALGCAAAFALVDGFVLALDAIALGALIAAPTLRRYGAARTLPLFAFLKAIGFTLQRTATGPFEMWGVVLRGTAVNPSPQASRTRTILLGVALAIPVLLIFGALFAEADPAFHAVATAFVTWDLSTIVQDLALFTVGTVGAAGALRAWFDSAPVAVDAPRRDADARPLIDPLALSIAVGAMTLIFTSYVALQFRYLFGGAAVVQSVTGLTVAEYARHGFFQVVQATALVIPILLVVDDLTRAATVAARWRLRLLSRVQLVLTLFVLGSAMARMWLYVDNFGLTEDRVISSTILVWLASVLVWFQLTVLSESRERFAFGAVVAGFVCLAALNLSVPDALIMRENVTNAISGKRPLDVRYAVRNAGVDGIPYLIAHLGELPPETRDEVITALRKRPVHEEMVTGRSFNLARWRALVALRTLR